MTVFFTVSRTFTGNVAHPPVNTEFFVFSPVALRLINQACKRKEMFFLIEKELCLLLSASLVHFISNGWSY